MQRNFPLFDNYIIRVEISSARTGSVSIKPGGIALFLSCRNIRIFSLGQKDSLAGLSRKPTDPRRREKNFSQNNELGTRREYPRRTRLGLIEVRCCNMVSQLSSREYPRRTRLGLIEVYGWCLCHGEYLEYPRRTRLGLIEVRCKVSLTALPYEYPRRTRLGLIEAAEPSLGWPATP